MNRKFLRRFFLGITLFGVCLDPREAGKLYAQTAAADSNTHFDKLASVPAYVLRTYHYRAEAGQTRVHVRFGIVNDVLQFTQAESGEYAAAYEVNLIVVDRGQNLAASKTWKRELRVAEFARTNDRQRLNEESTDFLLAPGTYELRVEISDLHTQRRLRRTYPLALPNFNEPRLQLSTLALGAQADSHDTLQYNLLAVLTDEKPEQGVFYEIYVAQAGDTLEAHYLVSDWKQKKLEEWRTTIIADSARVRCFEALSPKLKFQGLHHLRVTVRSRAHMAEAEVDYRVQFSTPVEIEAARLLQDYAGLAYLPLRYIASSKEHKCIIAAPPEHREALVAEFWQAHDPSPGTATNELREEFYRRVAFALRDGRRQAA